MSNRIEIDFTRSEGAVLRLIGLVERKGFDVCSVDMPETGPGPATPQATPVAVREREEAIHGDAVSVDIVGIAVDAASPAKPRGSVLDEFVRVPRPSVVAFDKRSGS